MNAEELKLITDAISSLGAQGKEALIWWVIGHYGLSFLQVVIVFAMIVVGVVLIARYLYRYNKAELDARTDGPKLAPLRRLHLAATDAWLASNDSSPMGRDLYEIYQRTKKYVEPQ